LSKKDEYSVVKVFTPMDENPLTYSPRFASKPDDEKSVWEVENLCKMASQVVIGIETLQLMLIVEAIVQKKIDWIPFSFHCDGFAETVIYK
jgi:hypothetical protein